MSGTQICLLACILAICLPILNVQLPRTELYKDLRSKYSEARPAGRSGPATPPKTIRWHTRRKNEITTSSYDGTHGGPTSEDEQEQAPQKQKELRKPWDPPFPREERRTTGEWHILPPTPPRNTRRSKENQGTLKRLFPPDADGEFEVDGLCEPNPGAEAEADVQKAEPRYPAQRGISRKRTSRNMLVLWVAIAVMAGLLFILAFAILIAHCLAWFLVYKTEARLGEARKGLLKGGDMRLCLCAA